LTGNKDADERHYLKVGRLATIFGVVVSIAAAYLASLFGNIMDFLQTIFSMINAPLFAVIFLGMFWKRTTGHAAFTGLLAGFLIALLHHGLTFPAGADTLVKGGWIAHLHEYPVEMAQNFWTAIFACATSAIIAVGLSLVTPQKKSESELKGLVYSLTPKVHEETVPWYQRSTTLAIVVLAIATVLTIIFW
jgi:SSS family solute:Na+ symporter